MAWYVNAMPKVKFVKEKKEIEVAAGTLLRDAMLQNGIQVYRGIHQKSYANCGGKGSCGTCRVYIKDGDDHASQKGLWERVRTSLAFFMIGHEDEARLSCQTKVEGDMTVEATPEFNWYGDEVKYTTRSVE
jgi:ferredoxin